MRHLFRHIVLIVAVVLLIGAQIFPLDKKLRRAKDLAGGSTLVYQVDLRPSDPPGTLDRMIELLKRRVDPNGVLDISIVAQGANRIEITMPLANQKTLNLRAAFEAEVDKVVVGALSAEQIQQVMAMPAEQRSAEIARLAGGDAGRLERLNAAVKAFDAAREGRAKFQERAEARRKAVSDASDALAAAMNAPQPDAARIAELQRAFDAAKALTDEEARPVAVAEMEYERARQAALATGVSRAEITRALELSDRDIKPKGGGEGVPSPQARALSRIRQAHPGIEASLDRAVAAWREYQKERSTLDSPQDLIRLLKGAGVLSFRIAARPGEIGDEARLRQELRSVGPRNVKSQEVRWFKLNKLESWYNTLPEFQVMNSDPAGYFAGRNMVVDEYDGELYALLFDVEGRRLTQAEGEWGVDSARQSLDEIQRPNIAFTMTELGGERMRALTGANLQRLMAVLLDDQVYTAPNIQSQIGKNGQISGNFTLEEIRYIVRVLNAGSLAAKLSPEPISVSTIAPQFGADNLAKGLRAGAVSFIAVAGFMIVYYFGCGVISVIALLINGLLILGIMAMNHAAFSLPGIAGVVLTFGMAVDANVLIYERVREELGRGADWRSSVRLGYARAMSSIVDGNLTTLIVVVVLAFLGTQEIKGFAITMIIGSITTMFTQLYITRVLFSVLIEKFRWRHGSMLPIKIPAIARAFHPNIDWMKYRHLMLGSSLLLVVLSFAVVGLRGKDLLENDFRGGTRVNIELGTDKASGKPAILTRLQAEERVVAAVKAANDPTLRDMLAPTVVPIDPQADRISSNKFAIKTTATNTQGVERVVNEAFKDVIDAPPALEFDGKAERDPSRAPVRPIATPNIRDVIDNPRADLPAPDFVGGVAIILNNISPPQPLSALEKRLIAFRNQPDPEIARTGARAQRWIVLDGDERSVRSAVVLVADPGVSFLSDPAAWRVQLAASEWRILSEALGNAQSLASVESFSAAIAATFTAQAIVAVVISTILILIYIWVRFQSLRYSIGAVLSTAHDCIVAVGAIAIAGPMVEYTPGLAAALGIDAFKIDLNVVAAVLTILGYSLNDTVIVMDRIRENRGKLSYATRKVINDSINQTISRTVITSGLTLMATLGIYLLGGEAMRAFAFTFVIGIITGTYSSVFIAAPVVWVKRYDPTEGGTPPELAADGSLNGQPHATESRRLAST
ncbi:MAG: protein translocase subunit SecD [Phycisphaeraceae bacterium]|nr:protein translocase subunit SecD [Phycisphaeraceae bacterium]